MKHNYHSFTRHKNPSKKIIPAALIKGLLSVVMLTLFLSSNIYADYCNNPTDVAMIRSGTNATITWTDNGSYYYYWVILTITPFGTTNWFATSGPEKIKQGGLYGPASSVSVTGLPSDGTLYAYVVGVNSSWAWCAPSESTEGSITITASLPTVITSAASSVGSSSAVLGGNVTADGGVSVSGRGVVYSSSNSSPTIGASGVIQNDNGSGTGSFSETISGLTAGLTYYFQAYATNVAGTSYGGVAQFSTNTPPVANNDTYTRFYTDTNISFTVPANGVLGNDTDADGNSLTVGTPRPASGPSHGTLTLNSNGSFTYTSTNGYKDLTDAFTYYAYDGTVNSSSPATVTIYIYTPRFTNGGGNGLFSNPANWNCGYVPNESLNIVIAAGQTMVVNQNYTCKNLKFETGSSFVCSGGSTLTITGDVLKSTGATAIDVNSSIQVKSSIQIQNP